MQYQKLKTKKQSHIKQSHNKSKKKHINNSIKNQTKKKQIGGRKIGKGKNICVVSPAIKCTKKSQLNGKISKISLKKSFKPMYEKLNNKLKSIDPNQDYLVYYDNSCILNKKALKSRPYKDIKIVDPPSYIKFDNTIDDIEDTNCLIEKDEEYVNIIENYGGNTVYNYILSKKKLGDPYKLFIHLLEGLKLLHDNKIVHRDIKIDNIVINSSTKKAKYIDFNNSNSIDDITINDVTLVGNLKYNIPFDYIILNYINILIKYKNFKYGSKLINTIIKICHKKYRNYIDNLNSINISYTSLLTTKFNSTEDDNDFLWHNKKGVVYDEKLSKLIKYMYKIYKKKTFLDYYKNKYLYMNDIYGLGILFKIILDKYNIKSRNLVEVSDNMVKTKPDSRFTVDQCLEFLKKN